MKKILTLGLVSMLAISIVGCGKQTNNISYETENNDIENTTTQLSSEAAQIETGTAISTEIQTEAQTESEVTTEASAEAGTISANVNISTNNETEPAVPDNNSNNDNNGLPADAFIDPYATGYEPPEGNVITEDGIDHGPEGDKPGYEYIPGLGYIADEGGQAISSGTAVDPSNAGDSIGHMN